MLCILIPGPFIRRVFHIEHWGGGAVKCLSCEKELLSGPGSSK